MEFVDNWLKPPTKKQRKRATLRENQRRGKAAETQAMMRDQIQGYEVERTGHGHDYRRRLRNPWTGRIVRSEVVEVKSGNAKLSPLQKKTKKKRSNYRVVREDPYFF